MGFAWVDRGSFLSEGFVMDRHYWSSAVLNTWNGWTYCITCNGRQVASSVSAYALRFEAKESADRALDDMLAQRAVA